MLKQILKKGVLTDLKDWVKYLPELLFALRDVQHGSLGFLPFNLVFARPVRGPITILREIKDP